MKAVITKKLLLLMVALFLGSGLLQAQTMFIQGFYAKLLETPGDRTSKILKIKRGEIVSVLKQKEDWFQVEYNKTAGWLHKRNLGETPPMTRQQQAAQKSGLIDRMDKRFAKKQTFTTVRRLKEGDAGSSLSQKVDYEKLARFENSAPSTEKSIDFINE